VAFNIIERVIELAHIHHNRIDENMVHKVAMVAKNMAFHNCIVKHVEMNNNFHIKNIN